MYFAFFSHLQLCLVYFALAALTIVRIVQVFMWGRDKENNIPFSVINFSGFFSVLVIGGYQPVLLLQVAVFLQTVKSIPLIEAYLQETAAAAAAKRKERAPAAVAAKKEHEAIEIPLREYAKTLPVIPNLVKSPDAETADADVVPLDVIDEEVADLSSHSSKK
jgi:hypothetical protein